MRARHLSTLVAVGYSTLGVANTAWSATINVTTTAIPGGGKCGLIEAVNSVNSKTNTSGCIAAGAYGTNDQINLVAGTYRLASSISLAQNVIIAGPNPDQVNGTYDAVSIDASAVSDNAIYIEDTRSGTDSSNLMHVKLRSLTLTGSWARPYVAGVEAVGTCDVTPQSASYCIDIQLDRVRVTGFTNAGLRGWGRTGFYVQNHSRIDHNTSYYGGGVVVLGDSGHSEARIWDTVIENNSASVGGGLNIVGLLNLAAGDIVRNNVASTWGGGIYRQTCQSPGASEYFSITGGTITNNTAGVAGGGLYFGRSAEVPDIQTSNISGNSPTDPQIFTTDVCQPSGSEPAGGLRGDYYNLDASSPIPPAIPTELPVFVRADKNINFGFATPPAPGINQDRFFVRWTGQIAVPTTGAYTFYITSDNGRRLWVNNQLVLNQWKDDWGTEYTSTPVTLSSGQKYDIRVEYFENVGGENIVLKWSSASTPKAIVPQSALSWPTGSSAPVIPKYEGELAPAADRPGIGTENCTENGQNLMDVGPNEWAEYRNLNLTGATSFDVRIANAGYATNIEFRQGSSTGTLIATCAAPLTGGWQTWKTVSCPISNAGGTQNLFLVFKGASPNTASLANVNWFKIVY